MDDYADAGYQLQHYKITFHGELEGNWLNFKTYHRAFASYDCARKWAANVLYRNRKYRGVAALRLRWNERSTHL